MVFASILDLFKLPEAVVGHHQLRGAKRMTVAVTVRNREELPMQRPSDKLDLVSHPRALSPLWRKIQRAIRSLSALCVSPLLLRYPWLQQPTKGEGSQSTIRDPQSAATNTPGNRLDAAL